MTTCVKKSCTNPAVHEFKNRSGQVQFAVCSEHLKDYKAQPACQHIHIPKNPAKIIQAPYLTPKETQVPSSAASEPITVPDKVEPTK